MRQANAIADRLGADVTALAADLIPKHYDSENYDVVIAAGRQAIAPARRIARKRRGHRPLVMILQPVTWRPDHFDLIWAPAHDRASRILRDRVPLVETITAPSVVTTADMARGNAALQPILADIPGPHVGVLVGGPSRAYRFGHGETAEFASRLAAFARAHEAGILLTTSGRTPPGAAAIFREALPPGRHFVFDATAPGALQSSEVYAGILSLAGHFVVTADSFAMMSEVAATGKPIYGWRLPGGRAKFDRFHGALEAHGALRWFDGGLDEWRYPPIDSTGTIAAALLAGLDLEDRPEDRI